MAAAAAPADIAGNGPSGQVQAKAELAEKARCHLHKKPSKNCKICQRVSEQASKVADEQKASKAEAQKAAAAAAAPSGRPVFNCSSMLRDQVLKSSYFKSLMRITTVEGLLEEIQNFVDSIDVYQVTSPTSPTNFFCCVFRLFTMEASEEDLQFLLDHPHSICARCAAFLYIRFAEKPEKLWEALEEYVLDEMGFAGLEGKQPGPLPATVGEYVESLLIKDKYFGTPLPRLPVAVKRKLEEKLAPLPQYRKRAQANRRNLKQFRDKGTLVEVCLEGMWRRGVIMDLDGRMQSRLKLGVILEDKSEVIIHLGKVILRDGAVSDSDSDQRDRRRSGRGGSRSRSRGRRGGGGRGSSPDWSRWKGKSDERMVRELREQVRGDAVCASGKEYARRPMGFEAGLAVRREQGSAETQLIQEDTFASAERRQRRRMSQDDDEEQTRATLRRSDEEQERQRKLMQIYEKYGQQATGAGGGGSRGADVEGPDVMRLG